MRTTILTRCNSYAYYHRKRIEELKRSRILYCVLFGVFSLLLFVSAAVLIESVNTIIKLDSGIETFIWYGFDGVWIFGSVIFTFIFSVIDYSILRKIGRIDKKIELTLDKIKNVMGA